VSKSLLRKMNNSRGKHRLLMISHSNSAYFKKSLDLVQAFTCMVLLLNVEIELCLHLNLVRTIIVGGGGRQEGLQPPSKLTSSYAHGQNCLNCIWAFVSYIFVRMKRI